MEEDRPQAFFASCPTCDYKERFEAVRAMEMQLVTMDVDDPATAAFANLIAQEIDSLLDYGYYIAEQVCEGNRRAIDSLVN